MLQTELPILAVYFIDFSLYLSVVFFRSISVLFSTFTLSLPRDCTKFVLPLVNLGGTIFSFSLYLTLCRVHMFSEDKIEQTQSEKKCRKECLPVPSRTLVPRTVPTSARDD